MRQRAFKGLVGVGGPGRLVGILLDAADSIAGVWGSPQENGARCRPETQRPGERLKKRVGKRLNVRALVGDGFWDVQPMKSARFTHGSTFSQDLT